MARDSGGEENIRKGGAASKYLSDIIRRKDKADSVVVNGRAILLCIGKRMTDLCVSILEALTQYPSRKMIK